MPLWTAEGIPVFYLEHLKGNLISCVFDQISPPPTVTQMQLFNIVPVIGSNLVWRVPYITLQNSFFYIYSVIKCTHCITSILSSMYANYLCQDLLLPVVVNCQWVEFKLGALLKKYGSPVGTFLLSVDNAPVHRTATYRCDDTRGCIIQFRPPDDGHMVLGTCRGMK
jgi:hypothetical protein